MNMPPTPRSNPLAHDEFADSTLLVRLKEQQSLPEEAIPAVPSDTDNFSNGCEAEQYLCCNRGENTMKSDDVVDLLHPLVWIPRGYSAPPRTTTAGGTHKVHNRKRKGSSLRLWAFTTILIVWAFSDGSPPAADAFSAQSLARRPLVGTNNRYFLDSYSSLASIRPNHKFGGHGKSGGGSLQKYHQNARPFASKFYVASTGRQLNSGSEQNSVYRYNADEDDDYNEDEVPWECVIDPTGLEECIQYMIPGQGTKTQYSGAAVWRKKNQAEEDVVTFMDKVSIAAVMASSISVFALLLKVSGPGAWRFFLAGGLCAATSHAIPTPIDVVKTKKQVDPELQQLGFVMATQKIIKDEGFGALLAGLGPTVLGYLLEGAMKFGVYEILKPATTRLLSSLAAVTSVAFLNSKVIAFAISGCVAGTAASIMLCPMEALRIRLVSEPEFAPKGWVQGLRRMIRREGVLSLWKGLAPQIYKQVPYTVTKNVSFDIFTRFAYRTAIGYGFSMTHATKLTIPLLCAVFASILSCISSQPGDMLLSLVSARGGEDRSTNEIARDIMRSKLGFRGFFVGLKERLYHVGIIVTLQLVLYDVLKRLCGGRATGAH